MYFFQKNSFFFFLYVLLLLIRLIIPFFCIDAAVVRPRLDKFYLDRIDRVCSFSDRSFHGLVIFSRLAAWGLDPIPTAENLGHEETTRRSKCRPFFSPSSFFSFLTLICFLCHRNSYHEGKQGEGCYQWR